MTLAIARRLFSQYASRAVDELAIRITRRLSGRGTHAAACCCGTTTKAESVPFASAGNSYTTVEVMFMTADGGSPYAHGAGSQNRRPIPVSARGCREQGPARQRRSSVARRHSHAKKAET